jgi:hypothetical protein
MDQETGAKTEQPQRGGQDPRRRRRRPPRSAPRNGEPRIFTKYAPRKLADGQTLSCTKDTTLKPEQLLELYRYLKLTRLVEERLVNLYRQT